MNLSANQAQWSRRNWSTPTAPPSVTGSTAGTSGPWSTHTPLPQAVGWVVVQAGCKFLFFFCVLEQTCHLLGYFRHLTPKHGCLFYAHVDPRTRVDDQRYFQPKKNGAVHSRKCFKKNYALLHL